MILSAIGSFPFIVTSLFDNRSLAMAILGGFENDTDQPVYLCRTIYKNNFYIGKYTKGFCDFAIGKKEISWDAGQLLFASPLGQNNF